MKVLVSTLDTQGTVPGDFSWTVDGELVTPLAAECSRPGSCGCGRSFSGLASSRATTTAQVQDQQHLDMPALRTAVRDSLERGGWSDVLLPGEVTELIEEHVRAITLICAHLPAGTVVRRNGDMVWHAPLAA